MQAESGQWRADGSSVGTFCVCRFGVQILNRGSGLALWRKDYLAYTSNMFP